MPKMNDKLKKYWIDGFKINVISIILPILLIPLIMLIALFYFIIPNEILLFLVGVLTSFILSFPVAGFLFKKLLLKDKKLNTFSEYWRFGWECNFILIILGLFAFLIITIFGLIYNYLNFIFPYIIATISYLAFLLLLIPLIEGYYFNKWMVIEKMHQGSTKNKGFFKTYWKAMVLFIGVYFFLSIYEATKKQTELTVPYLFGIILGLFIFSLIGFFVYDLIERKINKIKK